jgi:Zn-dependent M16 (insulinase) family peptidase
LTVRLNETKYLEELKGKDAKFWIENLRKYFDESRPHVVIRAKPSVELKEKMAKEEKERVEKRIRELGPSGLRMKKEAVEKAVRDNEVTSRWRIIWVVFCLRL